jgi:hypothetical protein
MYSSNFLCAKEEQGLKLHLENVEKQIVGIRILLIIPRMCDGLIRRIFFWQEGNSACENVLKIQYS